ncbi:hypothetical protein [Aliamphritea spongicola]|nr:hypothetical protein [Aliamphritea spongicola]
MDNDLAKGLAEGNAEKHSFLQQELDQMRLNKVNRKEYPARLNELANQFDQKQ